MKRETGHGGKPIPVDTQAGCSSGERGSRTAHSLQGVTSRMQRQD